METIELSGSIGLIATVVLTLNILLGILLSSAYKNQPFWKKLPNKIKQLNVNDIHNYTAYVALLLVFAHIIIIPLDKNAYFKWIDLIWPLYTQHQPVVVLLGTISFFALVVVLVSTQKLIKQKIGFRVWKNIHLISYITAIIFIIHGILIDPELKDRTTDFFDAEKLLSETCGLVLIAAFVWRINYQLKSISKTNQ